MPNASKDPAHADTYTAANGFSTTDLSSERVAPASRRLSSTSRPRTVEREGHDFTRANIVQIQRFSR